MKGDPQVIDLLNDVLTAELTAINQYFIHHKMCANWGYKSLSAHFRHESIDEMKDADVLIDRILFLDGVPNLQRYNPILVGETVPEMFAVDLELEKTAIDRLNQGIAACREAGDNGTRALLERILEGEEEHADWIEAQLQIISDIGVANYLAEKIDE